MVNLNYILFLYSHFSKQCDWWWAHSHTYWLFTRSRFLSFNVLNGKQFDAQKLGLFIVHGIHENVTWHVKMSQMPFSQMKGTPTQISLWRQLFLTTCGCIYKMLVTCATVNKDNKYLHKHDIAWELVNGVGNTIM
jgi:hypothetical protein